MTQSPLKSNLFVVLSEVTKNLKFLLAYPIVFVFWGIFPIFWFIPFILQGEALVGGLSSQAFAQIAGISEFIPFVVIGSVLNSYVLSSLYGMGESIRRDAYQGTLDYILAAPCDKSFILIGKAVSESLTSTIFALSQLAISILFFGIELTVGVIMPVLFILILLILGLYGIALMLAALSLRFKQAHDLAHSLEYVFYLFSPVRYPVESLPLWAQAESMTVAGGESECRAHWLKSLTKVPIAVELETTFSPTLTADEIGVTYWMTDKYKVTVKTTTSIPADITVEDLGDSIQWTIDMDEVEGPFNNGHAACGLVIGLGNEIVYQVHSNDGTDANYPWGTWLLSYWGPSGTGWHGWHTSYRNTPVSEIDGIDASGDRYLVAGEYDGYMPWGPVYHEGNPELIFTITINKGLLHCGEFKWAAALMGDTSDTYTPTTFAWSNEDTTNFHKVTIGTQITAPIIIQPQPHERINFVACYKFAKNISPGEYTVFTTIDLAP